MDLHPGLGVALAKFDWNETDVAKALAAGELTSPQRFMNSWFFRVRVSGTGFSFRPKLEEYVYRPVDVYISPEFLERVRGLPVIWEHPETMSLDTDELHRRIVGTIVLPYVGDADGENPTSKEVWGVARIIDSEAAQEMRDKQLSTSPAVDFGDRTDDLEREPTDDGRHLLIEGDPKLIDHLAICTAGVWDKIGPPSGVDRGKPPPGMDSTQRADDAGVAGKKERAMADEHEEKMEERKEDKRDDDRKDDMRRDDRRRDAKRDDDDDRKRDDDDDRKRDDEGGEHAEPDDELKDMVKRIADSVDRLAKRQDSIENRMDRKRDDRRDDDKRDDESEETERRQAAELEELAAEERSEAERKSEDDDKRDDNRRRDAKRDDKKRDDARRDDDDDDKKRDDKKRMDRKRDDARRDDRKRDDKKRDDEDMEEEEMESARGDSSYVRGLENKLAGVQDQLRDLQRKVGPRAAVDERELAEIQARADSAYSAFGERAQPPMLGETATAYQIRMSRGLQAHSTTWKDEDLSVLARHSPTAFANAVKGIYADAAVASTKRADDASGVLIPIPETSSTGHRIIRYQGDPAVWMAQFGADYGVGRLRDPRRARNLG